MSWSNAPTALVAAPPYQTVVEDSSFIWRCWYGLALRKRWPNTAYLNVHEPPACSLHTLPPRAAARPAPSALRSLDLTPSSRASLPAWGILPDIPGRRTRQGAAPQLFRSVGSVRGWTAREAFAVLKTHGPRMRDGQHGTTP